jgi:hypothetical protein
MLFTPRLLALIAVESLYDQKTIFSSCGRATAGSSCTNLEKKFDAVKLEANSENSFYEKKNIYNIVELLSAFYR